MKAITTITLSLSFAAQVFAGTNAFLEEKLYYDYQKKILSGEQQNLKSSAGFTAFEQSLFLDAIEDLAIDNSSRAINALDGINPVYYSLTERLRLALLRLKYKKATELPKELVVDLMNALRAPEVETKLVYTLAAYEDVLLLSGNVEVIDLAKTHPQYLDVADESEKKAQYSDDVASDLFYKTPDVTTYMNGEYVKSVKVYMYCRSNRLYPCLVVMKDIRGEAVRNEDGTLWTHKTLASSKYGLPSYSRNGNTPAGVHTIDSVMPDADQQMSYGKNRRMILNFIPKSKNEVLHAAVLPESSQKLDWWKANVVARDMGRNMFRIHGTGHINEDPTTPYYPFIRTSGCIANRENSYDGVTYNDVRVFLDKILVAMDLEPKYENEVKVKGILYLFELDDKEAPVAIEDLNAIGIE